MILGAVLAGGQSRRYGSDKAAVVWNGKTLVDHALCSLQAFVRATIICGRMSAGTASIPDRPSGDLGPLGGLNAALHYARAKGYHSVITIPCDAPVIPPALLAALAASDSDAFLASMPVIGIWRSAHADALDRRLETSTDRSMRGWAASIGAQALDLPPPPNINRPEDLGRLDPL